jgi:hypothetical protein
MTVMLPKALQEGAQGLAALGRLRQLAPWSWYEPTGHFMLKVAATLSVPEGHGVPSETNWVFLVRRQYPLGDIDVLPALDGLPNTRPHQRFNGPSSDGEPWLSGKVCLEDRRLQLDPVVEPMTAAERLAWRGQRLLAWIDKAAQGRLLEPGDPMEFAEFPKYFSSPGLLAFAEDPGSFELWKARLSAIGSVTIAPAKTAPNIWAVRRFADKDDKTILEPKWGAGMAAGASVTGIWLTFPDMPMLDPWGWPETWQQLRQSTDRMQTRLMEKLSENGFLLRDGRAPLLLGFPTAERVGGEPNRMHWIALLAPLVPAKTQRGGFRNVTSALEFGERERYFANHKRLDWIKTENWAADQLVSRGVLTPKLGETGVLILGGGALASPVGDLLARGGGRKLVTMDYDDLRAGNLVQHTLDIRDLEDNKAESLARRLNLVSPHVEASAIDSGFPSGAHRFKKRIAECGIVIDCTAEDAVLDAMHDYPWDREMLFITVSLGWRARRLYCFSNRGVMFAASDFRQRFAPWAQQELTERKLGKDEAPWEGQGCWHPVFPASGADVTLMAAVAAQFIRRVITAGDEAHFSVFERTSDDEAPFQIREVHAEPEQVQPAAGRSDLLVARTSLRRSHSESNLEAVARDLRRNHENRDGRRADRTLLQRTAPGDRDGSNGGSPRLDGGPDMV